MVDADPHNPGGEGSAPGGRLRLINLVVMELVELNRQRSKLLAALNYSSDLTKQDYSVFYGVFLEVYKLTDTLISHELDKDVLAWIANTTSRESKITQTTLRRQGLDLAEKLLDELSELGLLQLFEEQVAPPFLFDFDLLDAKQKIATAEAVAKAEAEKAANTPPVPIPVIPISAVAPPKPTSKKKKKEK